MNRQGSAQPARPYKRLSSGNARFDATLIDALASIKEFEPPTPDVKDIVTGAGVCLNFKKDR